MATRRDDQSWIATVIANPVKVAVGVLLVLLFGTIGLLTMPIQLTPEVERPVVRVDTRWPGASPQEVEREIINEQEEQLKQVEGVVKMTSECSDSRGRIELEFSVGTDISEALLKVSTRLQQVRDYPEDALEPVISTSGLSDRPIAWFVLTHRPPSEQAIRQMQEKYPDLRDALDRVLATPNPGLALLRLRSLAREHPQLTPLLPPPELDISKLRKFAEDVIEARFERVSGVANANVFGGRLQELQVHIDPERLAARGLTILDVRQALRAHNRDISGGDYWEGKRRYVVRTLGRFERPEDVGAVVLATENGSPVYLRDVARVELGYRKPTGVVRRFGDTAIAVNVERNTGANVLEVMAGLKQAAEELNRFVLNPRGLHLLQVYDETDYIYSAIGLVQTNLYLAAGLTVLVLLLFLRSVRSTLVLAIAIPTSVMGAFLILALLGRTLNVVSLAGMAFAIGMLVDNAVVVLENIYRHHQMGKPAAEAAVEGTREVWGAVLSSTLTTLAVFLPVLFVREEAGQLFRDIAIAISGGVGLSLFVAMLVIPTTANRLLGANPSSGRPDGVREQSQQGSDRYPLPVVDQLGRAFIRVVTLVDSWLLKSPARSALFLCTVVGAVLYFAYLLIPPVEYLPTGNRNLVIALIMPPPGYNLEELIKLGEEVERRLQPYWDVDLRDPAVYKMDYPPIADFFYVARGRQVFVGLRSADPMRTAELVDLARQAIHGFPGALGIARQTSLFERGLTAGRTIDVEITGSDLVQLVQVGQRILSQIPTVVPDSQAIPEPSLDLSSPELHVRIYPEKAAELGLTVADLGYAVDALVDGAYADDYFIGGEKVDLRLIGPAVYRSSAQRIEELPLATRAGVVVPLGAVARVSLSSGPEEILHRERQRAITIRVNPPRTIALEEAMRRIDEQIVRPLIEQGEIGEGMQIYLAGTADKLRQTWRSLRANFLIALTITYLLMAGLFESWLYPLVIILGVPLGALGGLIGLKLVNLFTIQPLDVLTMLGFVILIGTVVNNPILIVHHALLEYRRHGRERVAAILDAVRFRIRPIFMTTFTTVFGLLPLVLFPGAGSELYRGLGAVVLGGLLLATVVTLFVIPVALNLAWFTRDALGSLLKTVYRRLLRSPRRWPAP